MSKVLIIPGSPSQWSRCRWLMKIASSSGRPMLRSSWCCVPSPQSNRMRAPPARSSIAGSPRLGVGTEPAVPAKKIDRSMKRLARLADAPRPAQGKRQHERGQHEAAQAGEDLVDADRAAGGVGYRAGDRHRPSGEPERDERD